MKAAEVFRWMNNKPDWHATTATDLAAHFGVSRIAARHLLVKWHARNAWTRELIGAEYWYTVRRDSVPPVDRRRKPAP